MSAHRCSTCGLDWPVGPEYQKCPKCENATSFMHARAAMPAAEARSLKAHLDFEKYLSNESPEQRAAREAAADAIEAREIALLEAIVNGQTNPEPQEAT